MTDGRFLPMERNSLGFSGSAIASGRNPNWETWSCRITPGGTYRVVRERLTVRFQTGFSIGPPQPSLTLYGIVHRPNDLQVVVTVPDGMEWMHVYTSNDGVFTRVRAERIA